jgi:surface antigen
MWEPQRLHSHPSRYGRTEEAGAGIASVCGGVVADVLRSQAGTIGSLVGGTIGAQLDAEDQAALAAATRGAFESGKSRRFSNAKIGVKASVTVISTTKDASGRLCRTGKQDVTFKDGHTSSDTSSACKGANGKWDV